MTRDIVLRVPARTGSIHLLRTVATSAGAWSDLSVDDIDDVRLAVTEAASHLLSTHGSATTLCLRLSVLDGAMGIRVTVDRGVRGVVDGAARNGRTDGANGTPGSLAWQILLALSEELHVVDDDGEIGLAFTKPRHRSRP